MRDVHQSGASSIAPHGSIAINKGQRVAVTTNVTLTLWASDAFDPESSVPGDLVPRPPSNSASGVKEMLIGNRPDLTDGVWQPYATSKPWVLAAASGPKTVYVKYRDNAGNESPVTSATINLVPLTTSVCTASPLGVANGFNIFSLGNVSQSATDTQGRVAVGGNATFVNYSVGSGLSNSNGARDDLIVDSRLSYNNGTVYNGNITYGGTAALSAVNLAHGTSRQAHPLSFPAEQVKLELESTAWGTLPANGTTTVQYFGGPTAQITLTGTNATLNVFTISAADFSAANSLTIKAPAGSTVLVNIPGATPQMKNFGTSFVGTDKQHVLYNFFEANTLTVSGIAVRGSILAPYAAISFVSGSIDGTLIGSSLSGGGESHLFLFQGCAPVPQVQ